jgi:hypothetical protein
MDAPPATGSPVHTWRGISRGDWLFALAVVLVYILATLFIIHWRGAGSNRMMLVAERALTGHLDSDALRGSVDTVDIGGHYYLAIGLLQLVPYLPFAVVSSLSWTAEYATALPFGVLAAILALPLARTYGARGATAYWIAGFTAFGSLLLLSTVGGSLYWLAHAECFLALTLFLLEWAGRRRPVVLGLMLGLSFLARPTTIVAAVPFGLVLLWQRRERVVSVIAFGLPIMGAVVLFGWFNWVRFGSPMETGYSISLLSSSLEPLREEGLFSIRHIPENLRLALLALPKSLNHLPYFAADPNGQSMLLVSPALLTSLWAGFKEPSARLLWIAAGLVAVPVFMYYGGGVNQYGFRYALDFTPFLIALMAIGSRRWIGWPERLLILFSIASIAYGVLWYATRLHI